MEKKKILLVDDNVDFTALIKAKLESTGRYEVRVENQGSSGHRAAKDFGPDLILMDVDMPDMEGSEVAAQIMKDPELNVPIVFLTSIVNEKEVEATKGLIGGRRFISKGSSPQSIVESVERLLPS